MVPWLAMVVGVTLVALLLDLSDTGSGEVSLVLLLAPVLPVLGVAASWSRGLDPAYELTASVPRAGLYLVLGVVISISMQFAGVLLVFNFLVLPAVTGLLLARGMTGTFAVSVGAALVAAVVGFLLSIPFDLPTGPAMIAVSGTLVVLAWLLRRLQRR